MQDKAVVFRAELYYQGSAAWSRSKPVVSEVTLREGSELYLEDKRADHPNLPHYNFRISKITADAVILEQIPDRRGKIQPFYTGAAAPTREFQLEKGKPLDISAKVPGGGPVWTVVWVAPGEQPTTKRATPDYEDYKNVPKFFAMFLNKRSFSLEEAIELLGEKHDESLPQRILLKPKSPDVSWAQLEIGKGNFLEGISIQFAAGHHPSVSFSALARVYGEPHELPLPPPILEPGGQYRPDHSYRFDGRGVMGGYLILTVEGERKADLNPAVQVTYRRWLPYG